MLQNRVKSNAYFKLAPFLLLPGNKDHLQVHLLKHVYLINV